MIILYLYDNIIQYKEKEEIMEYSLSKDIMDYGKIKNIPQFENALEILVKKKKWKNPFKKRKLTIILPHFYNESDKEILTIILNNIGFKDIKLIKENSLLKLKKNNVLINIHCKYLTVTKRGKKDLKSYFIPYYIFGSLDKTLKHVFEHTSKNSRFFFIGNNKDFLKYLNLKQSNIYYYQDYKTYLIRLITP